MTKAEAGQHEARFHFANSAHLKYLNHLKWEG
jgi:hypothetical protein